MIEFSPTNVSDDGGKLDVQTHTFEQAHIVNMSVSKLAHTERLQPCHSSWLRMEMSSLSIGGISTCMGWWLDNEDMPSIHSSSNETPLDIAGPITRSRAKQLQKEIHSQVNANLMFNNQSMLNEPMLLSSCFNALRNDRVYEPAWDQDGFKPLDI
jgi:hypothetical protein